jgi:integrase
MHKEFESQKSR